MNRVIPFAAEENAEEIPGWIEALQTVMPEYRIALLDDMTEAEKAVAEVAIVANPNPEDLKQLSNLKWVQSLWAGVERLLAQTKGASFKIVRMTDPQLAATMAEAAVAWSMYIHRDIPTYRDQQAKKQWRHHFPPLPSERVISIMGMGRLGQASAQQLLLNGFTVQGWAQSQKNVEGVKMFSGQDGLKAMLQSTHILIVLLPLTPETTRMVNRETLANLPQGGALINFARGPIIDNQALLNALDEGHLKHAVLDVFEVEPLPQDSPFWSHHKITVTPHISAPTNRTTASAIAAKNIQTYFDSGAMPESVNREKGY